MHLWRVSGWSLLWLKMIFLHFIVYLGLSHHFISSLSSCCRLYASRTFLIPEVIDCQVPSRSSCTDQSSLIAVNFMPEGMGLLEPAPSVYHRSQMKHQERMSHTHRCTTGTAMSSHHCDHGHHHLNFRTSVCRCTAKDFSWSGSDDNVDVPKILYDMDACGLVGSFIFCNQFYGLIYCSALHRSHHSAIDHHSSFRYFYDHSIFVGSASDCTHFSRQVNSVCPGSSNCSQDTRDCHNFLRNAWARSHLKWFPFFLSFLDACSALDLPCGNDCTNAGIFGRSLPAQTGKKWCPSTWLTYFPSPIPWRNLCC